MADSFSASMENYTPAGIESLGLSVASLATIIALQNQIARASLGFERVVELVTGHALQLTGATGAVVEIADGDAMLYRAAAGAAAGFVGFRVTRAGSLAGRCIQDGAPLYTDDTAVDERVDRAACQRIGVVSMVCIPLFHDGTAVGVLKVYSDQRAAFDLSRRSAAALLADVVAASMCNARDYDAALSLSLHDALTGLFNRRAFDQQLAQALLRASDNPLSLIMFDVDGLKRANDTLGHAAGDAILYDVGKTLRQALRASDGCYRLGGDEFAAILPGADGRHARAAATRCRDAVAIARLGNGQIGVSGGVAEWIPSEPAASFVQRADTALYDDKRLRRGPSRATSRVRSTLPIVYE